MRLFTSIAAMLLLSACGTAFAMLGVKDDGAGNLSILRDGKTLVESIEMDMTQGFEPEESRSFTELPDGSRVWNRWCSEHDRRFRIEVAQRADNAVEITMSGEMDALCPNLCRIVRVNLPREVLDGKKYDMLAGNGRKYNPVNGVFDESYNSLLQGRWLAVDGLTFDFNPIGPSDYCSGYRTGACRGIAGIQKYDNCYTFIGGSVIEYKTGGYTGFKMVIREGRFEDYDSIHLMRSYVYSQHLKAKYNLSFGAVKAGKSFADGNVPYSQNRGYGWIDEEERSVINGYPEGAFYSCVSGSGRGTYRFAGLPDGFYIVTVTMGNYTGAENAFSIHVNADCLGEGVSVPARKFRAISRAVHIQGGIADIAFDGQYLLSSIGLQPVMGDQEDFSMERNFWVTDGYEPAAIYRSSETAKKPVLPVSDETIDMPVPGQEMAEPFREPPRPVLIPDAGQPSLACMKQAKWFRLLNNSSTLAELDDPQARKAFMDQETNGKGYNMIMVSGLHSRHTYTAHLERSVEAMRDIASELHARGMKLIDHHDATLLWNSDTGLRNLMERLPELGHGLEDGLPSYQYCPSNPVFCATYYAYLRKLLEAGVDGFQIDELSFWSHSCGCRYCREKFHEETGWQFPLNEMDAAYTDIHSIMRKQWFKWSYTAITNWFVELRRRNMDIRPDMILNMYTTHWGFIRSAPVHKASSNLIDLGRTINFFGTEVMPRNVMQASRPLLPFRKMKNILTAAYGSPVWGIYYNSNWQTDYFAWAVANMLCQSSMSYEVKKDADTPAYEAFGASSANMDRDGARSIASVALLFSSSSRDWNSDISFENELFGMAQVLESMHVPYDFIGDMSLNAETLSKYKALFLCASGCLSDQAVQVIRRFAENGGTVHLTTLAGVFDEMGEARKEWPFADIFGFAPSRTPSKSQAFYHKDGIITLEEPLLSFLPDGCKEDRYSVLRPFGNGRFIYCSSTLASQFYAREATPPAKFTYNPNLQLEAWFKEHTMAQLGDAICWRTNLPDQVYTSLWREKNGTRAIHFLNATGVKIKYGDAFTYSAPSPAFPLLENDIVFSVPGEECSQVTAYSPDFEGGRELVFAANDDGTVTVTMPRELLKAYTIVKIR